jgi:hypothetical protein
MSSYNDTFVASGSSPTDFICENHGPIFLLRIPLHPRYIPFSNAKYAHLLGDLWRRRVGVENPMHLQIASVYATLQLTRSR